MWSAPNYCYRCGNLACVLELPEAAAPHSEWHFNQFDAVPTALRRANNNATCSETDTDDSENDAMKGEAPPDYFL